jgi:hypothetical protein
MAQKIEEATVSAIVDYNLVGISDEGYDGPDKPVSPHEVNSWFSTSAGNVYLESEATIVQAEMHFETWDGPADFDEAAWHRSDVIEMEWQSGELALDQITAGATPGVYRLPSSGPWHMRLAWRDEPAPGPEELPWASVLVQFWRG